MSILCRTTVFSSGQNSDLWIITKPHISRRQPQQREDPRRIKQIVADKQSLAWTGKTNSVHPQKECAQQFDLWIHDYSLTDTGEMLCLQGRSEIVRMLVLWSRRECSCRCGNIQLLSASMSVFWSAGLRREEGEKQCVLCEIRRCRRKMFIWNILQ